MYDTTMPDVRLAGHRSSKWPLRRIGRQLEKRGAKVQYVFDGDLACLLEFFSVRAKYTLLGLSLEVSYDENAPGFAQERALAENIIGLHPFGVVFPSSRRHPPPYICDMHRYGVESFDFAALPPGKDCGPLPDFYRTIAETSTMFPRIDAKAAMVIAEHIMRRIAA